MWSGCCQACCWCYSQGSLLPCLSQPDASPGSDTPLALTYLVPCGPPLLAQVLEKLMRAHGCRGSEQLLELAAEAGQRLEAFYDAEGDAEAWEAELEEVEEEMVQVGGGARLCWGRCWCVHVVWAWGGWCLVMAGAEPH